MARPQQFFKKYPNRNVQDEVSAIIDKFKSSHPEYAKTKAQIMETIGELGIRDTNVIKMISSLIETKKGEEPIFLPGMYRAVKSYFSELDKGALPAVASRPVTQPNVAIEAPASPKPGNGASTRVELETSPNPQQAIDYDDGEVIAHAHAAAAINDGTDAIVDVATTAGMVQNTSFAHEVPEMSDALSQLTLPPSVEKRLAEQAAKREEKIRERMLIAEEKARRKAFERMQKKSEALGLKSEEALQFTQLKNQVAQHRENIKREREAIAECQRKMAEFKPKRGGKNTETSAATPGTPAVASGRNTAAATDTRRILTYVTNNTEEEGLSAEQVCHALNIKIPDGKKILEQLVAKERLSQDNNLYYVSF